MNAPVQAALDAGADPQNRTYHELGWPPMHVAAAQPQGAAAVRAMANYGRHRSALAELTVGEPEWTPLHVAAKFYRWEAAEVLLEHRSSLASKEDAYGETARSVATQCIFAQGNPAVMAKRYLQHEHVCKTIAVLHGLPPESAVEVVMATLGIQQRSFTCVGCKQSLCESEFSKKQVKRMQVDKMRCKSCNA